MVQRPWQSAQTLLLLTDAPWQQENFALDFHAHKMPVGLTLQELCTNAVSWESSVGLRTFFPLSTKTSRVWRTKKKKPKKPNHGKNRFPCVMLTQTSPACRLAPLRLTQQFRSAFTDHTNCCDDVKYPVNLPWGTTHTPVLLELHYKWR